VQKMPVRTSGIGTHTFSHKSTGRDCTAAMPDSPKFLPFSISKIVETEGKNHNVVRATLTRHLAF
jgi:hypothetical protein